MTHSCFSVWISSFIFCSNESTSLRMAPAIVFNAVPSLRALTLSSVRSSDNAARNRYAVCDPVSWKPLPTRGVRPLHDGTHILHILLGHHTVSCAVTSHDNHLPDSLHQCRACPRIQSSFLEITDERVRVKGVLHARPGNLGEFGRLWQAGCARYTRRQDGRRGVSVTVGRVWICFVLYG